MTPDRTWWLGLLLVTVVVYAGHVRQAGFIYEDAQWMRATETAPTFTGSRPLMRWSWWAQSRWTPGPEAVHSVNVLLHLAVGLLAGLLALRLGLSRLAAWFMAAFALLHPGHVQAVAYGAARPELLAAIGVIGACVAALSESRWRWLVVGVCVAFGFAGKESAVIAFALVPLTLWARARPWKTATCLGVALSASVAAWYGPRLINLGERAANSTSLDVSTTAGAWLLTQSAAAFRLIGLTLWPAGLSVEYPPAALSAQVVAAVALLALVAATWMLRSSHRLLAYGLMWTLLSLIPRFLVQTPRSSLNDHQFYTPSLGLILAGVALWDGWPREATA